MAGGVPPSHVHARREAQVEQKKEQEQTGQTWKDWCEEQKSSLGAFPAVNQCKQYTLIARYPGAYKAGDSQRLSNASQHRTTIDCSPDRSERVLV